MGSMVQTLVVEKRILLVLVKRLKPTGRGRGPNSKYTVKEYKLIFLRNVEIDCLVKLMLCNSVAYLGRESIQEVCLQLAILLHHKFLLKPAVN